MIRKTINAWEAMQAIAAGIRCYLLKAGEQKERKSGGRLVQLA